METPSPFPTTSNVSNTASLASAQSEYTRFRACDECRRRKIKCDGRVSGCRHCLNAAVQCVYNNPTKTGRKRAASSQKSKADPEAPINLEERLERIERAVKDHLTSQLSAAPYDDNGLDARDITHAGVPTFEGNPAKPPNPNPPKLKQRALYLWKVSSEDSQVEGSDGLLGDFEGKLRFIGESSVFSLFLPRGMQWVCEKLGEPKPLDPLSPAAVIKWEQDHPQDILVDTPYDYPSCAGFLNFNGEVTPLPSRQIVRKYVTEFFDKVNCVLPIFKREKFDTELGMFYRNGCQASPAWLLSLHSILALGCLSNTLEEPAALQTAIETEALEIFQTGCRNVPKILFCNRDISGIQALLATVLFLWETQSTEGCFTLLGVIASIGSEIGLHRCGTQLGLDPEEVDLRRNVFWVAYILDKDLCLRIGRSSSIVDHDITVRLPRGDVEGCSPRWFYHRVRLARILSKVSRLLCSHVSTTLPDGALLGTIKMLDAELEEWRKGCELMGNDEDNLGSAEITTALHNMWLRFVYYGCVGAIKRPLCPAFDLQEGDEIEGRGLSEDFESCLVAARSTIRLINYLERRKIRLLRSGAIHLVAAATTLFTSILENPHSETAMEDLEYLKRASEHLKAAVEKTTPRISKLFFLTYTLYSMASQTIARFQSGMGQEGVNSGQQGEVRQGKICSESWQ